MDAGLTVDQAFRLAWFDSKVLHQIYDGIWYKMCPDSMEIILPLMKCGVKFEMEKGWVTLEPMG